MKCPADLEVCIDKRLLLSLASIKHLPAQDTIHQAEPPGTAVWPVQQPGNVSELWDSVILRLPRLAHCLCLGQAYKQTQWFSVNCHCCSCNGLQGSSPLITVHTKGSGQPCTKPKGLFQQQQSRSQFKQKSPRDTQNQVWQSLSHST